MTRTRFVSGFVLFTLIGANASAADRCLGAMDQLAKVRSWADLVRHRKRYPHCDDGGIAEGYSEFVVHTLAQNWHSMTEVARLSRRDPTFRAFVLKHVDATTDERDLKKLRENALRHKLKGEEQLCREIAAQAKGAIRQLR